MHFARIAIGAGGYFHGVGIGHFHFCFYQSPRLRVAAVDGGKQGVMTCGQSQPTQASKTGKSSYGCDQCGEQAAIQGFFGSNIQRNQIGVGVRSNSFHR